jgi:hypothetical protein
MFKLKVLCSALACLAITTTANAETPISLFPSSYHELTAAPVLPKIHSLVTNHFDTERYKSIKAQIIFNHQHKADHVIVYLFVKNKHRVDVANVKVDEALQATSPVTENYELTADDFSQQPGLTAQTATCPDTTVQFIAFAPNYDDLEQDTTKEVANAAESHNLKVIRLLITDATRSNYLNYMACPNLRGNFYDGDANSQLIITHDGAVSAQDINLVLRNQFKFRTVNIWLACEAYNNPMKNAMLHVAQSQKYAAGKNDLTVGPSDKAAACAMEAALNGKPMKKSFRECYDLFDEEDDEWGFGGDGTNFFGV